MLAIYRDDLSRRESSVSGCYPPGGIEMELTFSRLLLLFTLQRGRPDDGDEGWKGSVKKTEGAAVLRRKNAGLTILAVLTR